MPKKYFTKSSINVADKFFTKQESTETITPNITIPEPQTKHDNSNNLNVPNNTFYTNVIKHTHVTNKSKYYDDRGKREERYGLLMDRQLKQDLINLCNATGSRSLNDFIVTILIDYTQTSGNQKKLNAYNELLNL